jgi:hypothetical protein
MKKRNLFLGMVALAAAARGMPLEQQFRELPIEARRLTGPLFWLHGDETPERLNEVLDKVAESGNGSFTAEARPHQDWLGEGWYRDLAVCLDAAKRRDLKMWIFDEDWWPSQTVSGRVPERYGAKRLAGRAVKVGPGETFTLDPAREPNLVLCAAGRLDANGAVETATLAELAPGKAWTPPGAGTWQVMVVSWKTAPKLRQGGRLAVDGLSRECVDWFIQTVYEPHHARFGKDFGKTIAGYFYDEPETPGDWGTEIDAALKARGVDRVPAYTAWLFKLAGGDQAAYRYQYAETRAETWGRVMYGALEDWCRARGVVSIGHFMEHGKLYVHNDYCAGDMMLLQKYSNMGGIDAVFNQFVMGRRNARDTPCWQTPKLGSSISHVYGKADDLAMVEIFGARGQDLTYPEMKWWADHMFASGINFMIPHSFNPRAPFDRDCPPYFWNGGFEPRYALYRVWADYASRLSVMLTGGRHVCPVAVLFSGNAMRGGAYTPPETLTSALQDALYDCDWLPFERFEDAAACGIAGNELRLHGERYRALVVPNAETITWGALAKARTFFEAGGTVIGYGRLPAGSLTPGKTAGDVAALRDAVWGADSGAAKPSAAPRLVNAKGGRSYFLFGEPSAAQVADALEDAGVPPPVRVKAATAAAATAAGKPPYPPQGDGGGTDGWVHALRRVDREGREVLFITNQNTNDAARAFTFHAPGASGVPEVWDALRGEVAAVPWRAEEGGVTFDLTLEANESALVRFAERDAKRPARLAAASKPSAVFPVVPGNPVSLEKTAPDGAQTVSPCAGVRFQGTVEIPAGALKPGARAYLVCGMVSSENEEKHTLRIIKATYTARDGAGASDVTSAVAAKVRDNALNLRVLPRDIGVGDPAERHVKDLVVEYELDGKRGRASAMDYGMVTIPHRAALETAGTVTVNGAYAGGFIGKPCRVALTGRLKPGRNAVTVEPFPVADARVEVYGE